MMKTILPLLLLSACLSSAPELAPGDCILGSGQEMAVWKLEKKEKDTYLFVEYPPSMASAIHPVTDLSTFKKVECPR